MKESEEQNTILKNGIKFLENTLHFIDFFFYFGSTEIVLLSQISEIKQKIFHSSFFSHFSALAMVLVTRYIVSMKMPNDCWTTGVVKMLNSKRLMYLLIV